MTSEEFRKALERQFQADGWKVQIPKVAESLLISHGLVTLWILVGQTFYNPVFPPLQIYLSERVHQILAGRRDAIIIVVAHHQRMFSSFELNHQSPFLLLHWSKLHFVSALRQSIELDLSGADEQSQWIASVVAKSSLLCRQRSLAAARAGQAEVAVDWAERAVAADRKNPGSHALLAQMYLQAKDIDRATGAAQAAVDLPGSHSTATFVMSQVEFRRGRLPESLEWARVSLEIEPQNPFFLNHIAILQHASGNAAAAQQAAEQALKLLPGDSLLRERLGKIISAT